MHADVIERPGQALTLCGCNLPREANRRRTKASTDQEMGGFRLGAGNALAKRVLRSGSGRTETAWGGLNTGVPAKATVWQIWQTPQVLQCPLAVLSAASPEAMAGCPGHSACVAAAFSLPN